MANVKNFPLPNDHIKRKEMMFSTLQAVCLIAILSHVASLLVFAVETRNEGPIVLLYQNNLNYSDDINHSSFLLTLSQDTRNGAQARCSSFSEKLLSSAGAKGNSSDLKALLNYQIYRGTLRDGETLWLLDGTVRAQHGSLHFSHSNSHGRKLRALCDQSSTQTTSSSSKATPQNRASIRSAANGNTYLGYRNKKSFRYLGIPYSNSPSRWQYSKANPQKNSHVNATRFGPECVQTGSGDMSEDCLFLNIYTPYLPASESVNAGSNTAYRRNVKDQELRPVLVWIHGGAYTSGSGSDPTFDGANIVSRGDVILVTINYRLSTLGFLAIPGTDIKGNYGIGDQVTALEWVKKNIEAFGGDPEHVTVYGQSAGAGSVRALLASPKARNLFAAAIISSNLGGYDYGTTYSEYYTPEQEYQAAGQAVINASNCANTAKNGIRSCLEKVSAADLVAQSTVSRFIIVDGTYIVSDRLDVTNPKNTANVPVLMGIMAEDAAPFIAYSNSGNTRKPAIDSVLAGNQTQYATKAYNDGALFPLGSGNNASLAAFNLSAQIATDVIFRCIDQATIYSALRNEVFPKAYFYQFERSYQTPGFDPNAPTCDAPKTPQYPLGDPHLPYLRCHSGDLYFEFGTFNEFMLGYRDGNDLHFNRIIMDYWTSFVRSYDPNPNQAYLQARNYSGTAETYRQSGRWQEVPKGEKSGSLRLLNVRPSQAPFQRQEQCDIEALPITYYETAS